MQRGAQTGLLDSDGASTQHLASFNGCPDMSNWLLYKGSWKNQFSIPEPVKMEEVQIPDLFSYISLHLCIYLYIYICISLYI